MWCARVDEVMFVLRPHNDARVGVQHTMILGGLSPPSISFLHGSYALLHILSFYSPTPKTRPPPTPRPRPPTPRRRPAAAAAYAAPTLLANEDDATDLLIDDDGAVGGGSGGGFGGDDDVGEDDAIDEGLLAAEAEAEIERDAEEDARVGLALSRKRRAAVPTLVVACLRARPTTYVDRHRTVPHTFPHGYPFQ